MVSSRQLKWRVYLQKRAEGEGSLSVLSLVFPSPETSLTQIFRGEMKRLGAFHLTKNSGMKFRVFHFPVGGTKPSQAIEFQVSRENTKYTKGKHASSFS